MSKVSVAERIDHSSKAETGNSNRLVYVTVKEICFLGFCVTLGGQFTKWNGGLAAGYWEYMIMIAIVGSGSLCVALCAAEMSSMLPFAGGAYGYVRCALGPTAGFLAGFSEAVKYTISVAAAANQLGLRIITVAELPEHWTPALWLVFYALAIPIVVPGGRTFWNTCIALGTYVVLLVCIYCFGAIPIGQMTNLSSFNDGGDTFMMHVCQATVFVSGFNSVTLFCSDVKEPTKVMPKAYIFWVVTALVSAFCIVTAGVSMAPSIDGLAALKLPWAPGFHLILDIPRLYCPILLIPAVFANGLGDAIAAGRQIRSMAGSGLFPSFLLKSYHGSGQATPVAASAVCMLLGYLILLFLYYSMHSYANELFQMSLYGSAIISIFLMRAYVVFYTRYSSIERQFVSPVGLYGAYYGMAVYSLLFISAAFFFDTRQDNFYKFAGLMIAAFLCYYFIARKTEFFSKEEQKMFMKAYIVNTKHGRKKGLLMSILKAISHSLPTALSTLNSPSSLNKGGAAASHEKDFHSAVNNNASHLLSAASIAGNGALSGVDDGGKSHESRAFNNRVSPALMGEGGEEVHGAELTSFPS